MKAAGYSLWAVGASLAIFTTGALAQDNSITATPTVTARPTLPVSKTWPTASAPTYPDQPRDTQESPSFPDPEYVKLLDYTLLFFEAQRSGKLPPDQRITWRNDSALNDGKDVGIDLSGGYYDAGDYLKFIFPLTFALSQTCWGGLEFYEGYQLADETKYLDQMVRWGMDWLIKAHPNNNTLFVQVGVSEVDNNYWGPDTHIPLPRNSFQVNNTHPGTDVMADAAAAFASCSMLYRDKLNDTAYANILQTHAESLFRLAETATPQQVYQTVVPAVTCCYASSDFVDELAWGAAWMYKLTKNTLYAQKAARYIDQLNIRSVQTSPVTWDDKCGIVYILMAGATVGTVDNNEKWQGLAEEFAQVTVDAPKPCSFTKDGSSISASAQENIDRYRSFALGQINYLLGANPLKTPYIVGVHHNSPINPHSAPASGGISVDSIDTFPEKETYTIYGALVGGPDKNDRFEDHRSDWRQNEVALDYNAPFNGLMAYQVMTSKLSPPYVTIPAGRPDLPPILNGMEVWQIILIVIGSIFVAVAIGAIVCYRKREQIRTWAAARKQGRVDNNANKHSMKNLSGPHNRNNQEAVVSNLAAPPPLPNGQERAQSQGQRPVPAPPLPSRNGPILLEDAQRM
ncbi:hypothetical protein BG011_002780 [Mortierella polycephala]|uniref:Endoglucanase n=1 Tax=Mortierella polycephala TaxID=41804 RepID=A0A9P6U4G0_9FUNG|nr:hypothetical protein BG011_002780 [Mortierella polycephala]